MVRFGDKIWRISSRAINKIPIPRGRSFSNAVEKTLRLENLKEENHFEQAYLVILISCISFRREEDFPFRRSTVKIRNSLRTNSSSGREIRSVSDGEGLKIQRHHHPSAWLI